MKDLNVVDFTSFIMDLWEMYGDGDYFMSRLHDFGLYGGDND